MLRKKLGEILISLKLITQEQLNDVLEEQKSTGERVGKIAIKKGYITKVDLARALAQQIGVTFVDKVTEQMADPKLLAKIPLRFLRQHAVIPVIINDVKTILTADPMDVQPLDDLNLMLRGGAIYAISTDEIIVDAINKYYPLETGKEVMEELAAQEPEIEMGAIEEKDILEMANEAPIIKLVNTILFQAVKEEASDIHVESFEKELRVRFRIDGVMHQKFLPPKRYQGAIVSRIKIMAHLNIAEKRLPQDGRILIKIGDKSVDIRVSVLPGQFGERVVMRLLDKSKGIIELEKLGLATQDFDLLTKIIERPNGIVLVTGPTGSGKTTTLYAIINRLNRPDTNIITVEDPVEYTITGVSQVQINDKIGLTFATTLRSILRQDPDIILIGEIRDKETAQIATQAALTGHLVLSTLHTNNAPTAITRLTDIGVEPFLISSTVAAVLAQRLVRRLCDNCKKPHKPAENLLERIGMSVKEAAQVTFMGPVGCDDCMGTGYRGRMAIFELIEITDEMRGLIVQRVDASVLRKKAVELKMTQLVDDGIRRLKGGITSLEEVLSVAFAEQEPEMEPYEQS